MHLSIAGAFSHYRDIMNHILHNKKHGINITVYDSFMDSPWNGGRISRLNPILPIDETLIKIRTYNKLGIGVYITFSNYIIDDLYANDENAILAELNTNPINGVILVNDELGRHIRASYSNLTLHYSVSGFATSVFDEHLLAELFCKYDVICPRYEWVYNPSLYEKFDCSRFNIMLNDCCKANCPLWSKHFRAISDANRDRNLSITQLKQIQECWLMTDKDNPSSGWACDHNLKLGMNISNIRELVDIGYSRFKLCGRDLPTAEFIDELSTYWDKLHV